ncbi:MAG: hypothetical protein DRH04_11385 [Deltaproteobacteria bacterium]|nr:MAG: hypothetical protein DRH04_11385 [Deltaproteobacteria bacterium]
MKRILLFSVLCMFFAGSSAKAEDNTLLSFQNGDRIFGIKIALGSVFGSKTGFVVSGEYVLKDNFIRIEGLPNSLGVGGSLGYSSFTEFVFPWGDYSYQNYLFLGSAFWHVNVLRQEKIDTYLRANLGVNINTSSKPGSSAPGRDSTYGGLVFGLSLGGRYYFQPNLAGCVEMGFGMGNIRLGLDYRF